MRWMRKGFWVALLAASTAQADPENITWGELALTHPICYHVQAIPITGWTQHMRQSPDSAHWDNKLGGGGMLWAMHHYCWALIHLLRVQSGNLPPNVRTHLIGVAVSDFYYVANEARRLALTNSFRMMPEILYRIGDGHSRLGQTAQAIAAFEEARMLKPDYWPPYIGQALLYEKARLPKRAMEVLEQGLQIIPGEPNLSAAYLRLGGKPASVQPLAQAAPSVSAPAAAASAAP